MSEEEYVKQISITNEEANYDRNAVFQKGAVVDFAIRDCYTKRAKEMMSGYFNVTITKDGEEKKEYINDSRKTFISSVKGLMVLLTPEILNPENKTILDSITAFEKSSEDNFNKYCYEEQEIKNGILIPTGFKFIPEEDESLIAKVQNADGTRSFQKIKGLWNNKIKRYWDEEVEIWTAILGTLSKLIHMENYFAEK